MRHALEVGGSVGAVFGLYIGIKFGHARARALRAWRDFKAAKSQVKAFIRETLHQWRLAAQVGLVFSAVTAAIVLVLVSR